MLGACAGWRCDRMISMTSREEANPYALDNPDAFSVEFAKCVDCKKMFCDRCAGKRRGPSGGPVCSSCGGELGDGRRYWEQLGRLPYPEAVTCYNEARNLAESGRVAEALSGFEQAARLRPGYVTALFDSGVALNHLGRHRDAVRAFDDVLRADAGHAQAAFDKAAVHTTLGETRQAIDAYDLAIRIEPRFAEPYINKANALMAERRYDESLAVATEAVRLLEDRQALGRADGLLAYAYGVTGACQLILGRDTEALEALELAIESGLDDHHTQRNRATALERLGRHEEARLATQMADDAARTT